MRTHFFRLQGMWCKFIVGMTLDKNRSRWWSFSKFQYSFVFLTLNSFIILKKLVYLLGFSFLKPKLYIPIRILLILYYAVLLIGLVYDLSTERTGYYSTNADYLQILLADSAFYYIYVVPLILLLVLSYLWDFFLNLEKKSSKNKTWFWSNRFLEKNVSWGRLLCNLDFLNGDCQNPHRKFQQFLQLLFRWWNPQ